MTFPSNLAALVAQVTGLATAIENNIESLPAEATDLTNTRNSAQAALSSQTAAASSASSASTSASGATSSESAAQSSLSSAVSNATAASGSETSAATDATDAGSSASAASTSATNATNSNTAAQGYNTRAQSMLQVAPVAAAEAVTGGASTTWSATCSFTAPCAGWVFAKGSFNLYQLVTSPYQCELVINGTTVQSDTTLLDQYHMGVMAVTEGEVVTVQMEAISNSTAPDQNGTLHVVAFFIPNTV
jgi:hypothetical protein